MNDGVIGEIGTANMRTAKLSQLSSRLRDLQRLIDEEVRAETYASSGRPIPWHGMRWRTAEFHPEEGPVVIAVDANRVISTHPTFDSKTNGLYLYQLIRYKAHRLRVGDPVIHPRLSGAAQNQLQAFWNSYQQPGSTASRSRQKPWFESWPSLHHELLRAVDTVGIAAVAVASVAVVIAAVGATAAMGGLVLAGFVAVLVGGLSQNAPVGHRLI